MRNSIFAISLFQRGFGHSLHLRNEDNISEAEMAPTLDNQHILPRVVNNLGARDLARHTKAKSCIMEKQRQRFIIAQNCETLRDARRII